MNIDTEDRVLITRREGAGGKAKMKAPDIPDNTNTDKIWRQGVSRLAAAPLLYAGGCVVEGWRGSLF